MDGTGPDRNGSDHDPVRSDPITKFISTQNWKKSAIFSGYKQIMVNLVNLRGLLTILCKEEFKLI